MTRRLKLELFQESWENLIKVLHSQKSPLQAKGNFWAAIQTLEAQIEALKEQDKDDVGDLESPNQLNLFNI